jgi:hypothetical protein
MNVLNVGDRVRLITRKGAPKLYGVIDAKQAGVYRIKLTNGETILAHRTNLAYQSSARSAQQMQS